MGLSNGHEKISWEILHILFVNKKISKLLMFPNFKQYFHISISRLYLFGDWIFHKGKDWGLQVGAQVFMNNGSKTGGRGLKIRNENSPIY